MNWRRGLFRLWIVGTVLFVLAIAFLSYSEIKADFERFHCTVCDYFMISSGKAQRASIPPCTAGFFFSSVLGPRMVMSAGVMSSRLCRSP